MPQVDGAVPRLLPPSCKLEALNSDVLTLILCSCDSSHDLWSFIRASPIIYHAFHGDKAGILCRMNFAILGGFSATRKAIFLARCDPVSHDGDYQSNLENVLSLYQDLQPRQHKHTGVPVANDLGWDTIVQITKHTRALCYFACLYALFRFRLIENIAIHRSYDRSKPPLSRPPPLSASERARLITGLLNWELVHNLHGQRQPRDLELFIATVFPLFEAWEWEQIAGLDSFVVQLTWDLLHVLHPEPGARRHDQSRVRAHRATPLNATCYPNLDVVYSKLLHRFPREEYRNERTLSTVNTGPLMGIEGFRHELKWLLGTNVWRRLVRGHYLPLRGLVDTEGVWALGNVAAIPSDEAVARRGSLPPPWAWVQAMGGKRINRWGSSLVPSAISAQDFASQKEEYVMWKHFVGLWRWLGMVFWDRERAEEILTLFEETGDLVGCGRVGWLVDVIISYKETNLD